MASLTWIGRGPHRITGCLPECVSATTAIPQIVADLVHSASRRPRAKPGCALPRLIPANDARQFDRTTRQNLCSEVLAASNNLQEIAKHLPTITKIRGAPSHYALLLITEGPQRGQAGDLHRRRACASRRRFPERPPAGCGLHRRLRRVPSSSIQPTINPTQLYGDHHDQKNNAITSPASGTEQFIPLN